MTQYQQQGIYPNMQNIESGYQQQHEEIPLNRLNSAEENADRMRKRQIFNAVS